MKLQNPDPDWPMEYTTLLNGKMDDQRPMDSSTPPSPNLTPQSMAFPMTRYCQVSLWAKQSATSAIQLATVSMPQGPARGESNRSTSTSANNFCPSAALLGPCLVRYRKWFIDRPFSMQWLPNHKAARDDADDDAMEWLNELLFCHRPAPWLQLFQDQVIL